LSSTQALFRQPASNDARTEVPLILQVAVLGNLPTNRLISEAANYDIVFSEASRLAEKIRFS
jgi:hypothetical protein